MKESSGTSTIGRSQFLRYISGGFQWTHFFHRIFHSNEAIQRWKNGVAQWQPWLPPSHPKLHRRPAPPRSETSPGCDFSVGTLWLCQNGYWTWPIYSWFTHEKWWFFHNDVSLPEGNPPKKDRNAEEVTMSFVWLAMGFCWWFFTRRSCWGAMICHIWLSDELPPRNLDPIRGWWILLL